jgi:CBS domain-containing protein
MERPNNRDFAIPASPTVGESSIAELVTAPPAVTPSRSRSSSAASNNQAAMSPVFPAYDDSNAKHYRRWEDDRLDLMVQPDKLVFVEGDTPVEKAFDKLVENHFTSLPVRTAPEHKSVSHSFDYADLNAYLLLVMGYVDAADTTPEALENVKKARSGQPVPVNFVAGLGAKDPFICVPRDSTLATAVEILGSGVHRFAVTEGPASDAVIGILSQRRTVRYIWENGRLFKTLEPLFQTPLTDLGLAQPNPNVLTIGGDEYVIAALRKMNAQNVSSLAVVDASNNLLGNISVVDVRLVSKSSQSHLLKATCAHFLSVILNARGLEDGKDSFPVFHVTPQTSYGRTIAKMVATNAHRLWVVQPDVPSPQPSTPSGQPASKTHGPSHHAAHNGKLIGVVSLTDILNVLGRHAGNSDLDPHFARRNRRRSSSSSVRSRSSYEQFRRSISIDRGQR